MARRFKAAAAGAARIAYKYGVAETLGYERTEGGSYIREHRYTPNDGGRPVVERVFCAGPDDASPMHSTYPTGYDSKCSCCYLNITHTDALHERRTGKEAA